MYNIEHKSLVTTPNKIMEKQVRSSVVNQYIRY